MSWTLTTSGSAIYKASINASSALTGGGATSETILTAWSDEAEDYICDLCRVNVVSNYATLTANGKKILGRLASSLIAENIVGYDMDAIGRSTAIAILNILENNIRKDEALIKDDKIKTYLAAT